MADCLLTKTGFRYDTNGGKPAQKSLMDARSELAGFYNGTGQQGGFVSYVMETIEITSITWKAVVYPRELVVAVASEGVSIAESHVNRYNPKQLPTNNSIITLSMQSSVRKPVKP